MIELKNVTVTCGGHSIIKNVSAHVQPGDVITIIGPNGAGKSTLLELIAGTIKPTSGSIWIDGNDVTELNDIVRAPMIARLCQNPNMNVVNTMSVIDNLILANLKGRRACLRTALRSKEIAINNKLLATVVGQGLNGLIERPMGALSGGQRQTIALAMATLKQPKVLLLDEPTAALDPTSAGKMLNGAVEHINNHSITTLLITHDVRIAKQIGNKLWVIEEGCLSQQIGIEKRKMSIDQILQLLAGFNDVES